MSDRLEWLNLYKDELLPNIRNVTICIGEPDMAGRQAEYFEDDQLEWFYRGFLACSTVSRLVMG